MTMSSQEDWLLRPVIKGLCKYESLKVGAVDLLDIAKLNEALDVEIENQRMASDK